MRIYVGNLDYNITSEQLRDLFAAHGEVALAEVQIKGRAGRSRGFGFIEMPNDREGEAAITALNGKEIQGRALTVNESRPRRTIRDLYAGSGWFGGR